MILRESAVKSPNIIFTLLLKDAAASQTLPSQLPPVSLAQQGQVWPWDRSSAGSHRAPGYPASPGVFRQFVEVEIGIAADAKECRPQLGGPNKLGKAVRYGVKNVPGPEGLRKDVTLRNLPSSSECVPPVLNI